MTQRNSPARKTMLVARRTLQEQREFGEWTGGRFYGRTRPAFIAASINRRTGEPHEHNRAKARHLRQIESRP